MLVPSGEHDGWWFLNQRQRIPVLASVPVVIMTSLSVACEEWAVSLGAAGLIRMPFEVEPLLADISCFLGNKSQGDKLPDVLGDRNQQRLWQVGTRL
jgi:hypothetical protein